MSSSPFHHSAFYQGTKKIAPLKVRNPSIHPSQIMPSPSGVPFNVAEMPWSYNGKPGQVMEFNAVIRPSPLVQNHLLQQMGHFPAFTGSGTTYADIRKRKTDPDVVPIPTKQFLSEEVMASHLNSLHLSSEYTSHNIETESGEHLASTSGRFSPSSLLDDEMSLGEAPGSSQSGSHHVYMSPQELEARLKKAQRISLCEEVRKLDSRTEILPKVLLERIEKPCTALVIWQPPQPLEKLITTESSTSKEKEQQVDEQRSNEETMGEDEPLPDLPDYDDDLDFEENNNNVSTMGDFNRMDVEM